MATAGGASWSGSWTKPTHQPRCNGRRNWGCWPGSIPPWAAANLPIPAGLARTNVKLCYNSGPGNPQPHIAARWRPPTAILARQRLSAHAIAAALDLGPRRALEAVRQLAAAYGTPAYLVGGPVRDALLGTPLSDLDFAVVGHAPALAQRVAARLPGSRVTVHPRFGTAIVALPPSDSGGHIDLVTARRECYPRPGQLPQVTPGGIADDLARRDFSINAMALPLTPDDPELLDPQGGRPDLESGVIRILHPGSFADDPTRMLRAVRYEQRFGFRIDAPTLTAMSDAIAGGAMDAVSGDRWRRELERILDEANPSAPLQRAAELGLLAGIHPALGRGLPAYPGHYTKDECLAALFAPLSTAEAEQVIGRLRLAGPRAALGRDTIALRDAEPQIRAHAGRPSALAALLTARAPGAVAAWAGITADPVVAAALHCYVDELRFIKPSLDGIDLLQMGAAPGPAVGEILARLRDARLDGAVSGAAGEREMAQALLAQHANHRNTIPSPADRAGRPERGDG